MVAKSPPSHVGVFSPSSPSTMVFLLLKPNLTVHGTVRNKQHMTGNNMSHRLFDGAQEHALIMQLVTLHCLACQLLAITRACGR